MSRYRIRTLTTTKAKLPKRAKRLLREAASALQDEIDAAGEDSHPVIKAHARLMRRIRKYLASVD